MLSHFLIFIDKVVLDFSIVSCLVEIEGCKKAEPSSMKTSLITHLYFSRSEFRQRL